MRARYSRSGHQISGRPRILRGMTHQLQRAVDLVLAPPPAHALEDQSGVALQALRHALHRAVDAAGHIGEADARIGQGARIRIDQLHDAARLVVAAVPDHLVEPPRMVGGGQMLAVALQEAGFLLGAETAAPPGLLDRRDGLGAIIGAQQRLGIAHGAVRRGRAAQREPGHDHRIVRPVDQGLLGPAHQDVLHRPVGIGVDERGQILERNARTRLLKLEPAQDLVGHRLAALGAQPPDFLPAAGVGGREGPGVEFPLLGGQDRRDGAGAALHLGHRRGLGVRGRCNGRRGRATSAVAPRSSCLTKFMSTRSMQSTAPYASRLRNRQGRDMYGA